MKYCPKCGSQYTDDTLSFCLEDGTRLGELLPGDMPTAILSVSEELTSVRSAIPDPDPRFMDSQVTRVASRDSGPSHFTPKRSSTMLAVVLTAVGMMLLFSVVGLVGYFFFLRSDRTVATNTEPVKNANILNVNIASVSPMTTPAPSPAANTIANTVSTPISSITQTPVDVPAIRSEVLKEIFGQKSARDSRDLSSYMSYYAGTLDRYYTKSRMSRAEVRADKARHFANYTSMQSDYSNMNVNVSPDGQMVTVVFDKEWNFSGIKNSSGKVQSQLIFKRLEGRWLIATERDLKVYYTR